MKALREFIAFLFAVFMLFALIGMFTVVRFFERIADQQAAAALALAAMI